MADLGREGLVLVFSVNDVVSGKMDENRLTVASLVVDTGVSNNVLWPLREQTEQLHEHLHRSMSPLFPSITGSDQTLCWYPIMQCSAIVVSCCDITSCDAYFCLHLIANKHICNGSKLD